MGHHTSRQIINAALVSRGMAPLPAPWCCPCCGDATLSPEDQAEKDLFIHGAELIERYGSMPCFGCADEHELCAQCGKATKPGDYDFRRNDDGYGEAFCCGECAAEWWRDAT